MVQCIGPKLPANLFYTRLSHKSGRTRAMDILRALAKKYIKYEVSKCTPQHTRLRSRCRPIHSLHCAKSARCSQSSSTKGSNRFIDCRLQEDRSKRISMCVGLIYDEAKRRFIRSPEDGADL